MRHIAGSYRSNIVGFHRRDSGRVTIQGDKLDLVRFSISIDVDDGADITGRKFFLSDWRGKHNSIMFLEHRHTC